MANEKHLRIFQQGVVTWNQWRGDYPNEIVDLSEASFAGTDLARVNLAGTDLARARLTEAHLFEADFTRAHLSGAHLSGAHLFEAHLTEADLTGADLTEADLIRADLTGADLLRADFLRADLTGADLTGADLTGANLTDANLTGADLTDANLTGANLTDANLTGANLTDALLSYTVLGNTDLTDAKGLDSCTYYGSSILDHQTLTKSGRLPLTFLRGCGLPEIFINYIPALFLDNPLEFYSCFISYANADQAFAERLHADLQDKGVRCWFAPEDIKIGDPVRVTIDTAIRLRDKLVLILSDTSIVSDWVEHEVSQALQEEERRGTLVLFPLRIDEAVMQVEFGWAKRIREAPTPTGRHIGDFTEWKEHDAYQRAFARLLRDLTTEDATNPS